MYPPVFILGITIPGYVVMTTIYQVYKYHPILAMRKEKEGRR